ncbi:hypothetical protein N7478_004720 [Penicillium angulare]|uniref:uncharacterized protein n=1 Tax=Penicillium angulare TaxID=116970 RepID=UPI002541D350|nr:uncharacterized protein N7478_004720 [Penicillium angulare]KAJ5279348.1 hypothetical protein N7478_004720 [Penicillium angulare]
MENQPPNKTTISGDLPVRSARRTRQHDCLMTPKEQAQREAKKVSIEDEANNGPWPKPKTGKKGTELDEEVSVVMGPDLAMQSKNKKTKRPKSKRGLGKPTGFEEWSAEGPMTPEEHEEDLALYDPRIEDALMRFQRKRRMESLRTSIFHKFLQYGGISVGPNFGTGVPARQLKEMTKEEIMQARNQTLIEKEREILEVSFTQVIRGFLGSFYMTYFHPDSEATIKFTTSTIQNFYTYLLYHQVCPEYTEDILNARKTCDLANEELWKNMQLICDGPGSFNKSCSMLFGGQYYESRDEWSTNTFNDGGNGLTRELAQKTVRHAIAGAGSYEVASRFLELVKKDDLEAKRVSDIDGFEIISKSDPDDNCRDFYQQLAKDLTPVGIVKAKSFIDPAKPKVDLSPKERWEWDHGKKPSYEFTFFIEMSLLPLFYPGSKVLCGVWELNCGVFFFDSTYSVYPTFYNVIANDMMLTWKRPRDVTKDDESTQKVLSRIEDSVKEALQATSHGVDKDKDSKDSDENEVERDGDGDGEGEGADSPCEID